MDEQAFSVPVIIPELVDATPKNLGNRSRENLLFKQVIKRFGDRSKGKVFMRKYFKESNIKDMHHQAFGSE